MQFPFKNGEDKVGFLAKSDQNIYYYTLSGKICKVNSMGINKNAIFFRKISTKSLYLEAKNGIIEMLNIYQINLILIGGKNEKIF